VSARYTLLHPATRFCVSAVPSEIMDFGKSRAMMEEAQHEKGMVFPKATTNAATFLKADRPRYSICSIVTRPAEYAEMLETFDRAGFEAGVNTEFLYLDNSTTNQFEAYSGYNLFLRTARGPYIILCHQDLLLLEDGIARLDAIIAELDALDPAWALFGNGGGIWPNKIAVRMSDKFGENQSVGAPFPVPCLSLDENFIVVRADANLALSRDLSGFHFYGTELCIVAAHLGYSAYVVDFHLYHKGAATQDKTFFEIRQKMIEKYSRLAGSRMFTTTCSEFVVTPWLVLTRLANTHYGTRISTFLNKLFRPRQTSTSKK
jgi:hypothetical protein